MKRIGLLTLLIAAVFAGCKKDDNESFSLKVNVKSLANNTGINAYIFLGDSLYGTTNGSGEFSAPKVNSGKYELTVSAVYFRDTTLQLNLDQNTELNFSLAADSTMGKVYGEFEDMYLWREELKKNADMASWEDGKVWQATTGATICYKYFDADFIVPKRYVLFNNDTIAQTDDFGQYWAKLQCGKYKLTGICKGYSNSSGVVTVRVMLTKEPQDFLNFYLERK